MGNYEITLSGAQSAALAQDLTRFNQQLAIYVKDAAPLKLGEYVQKVVADFANDLIARQAADAR